MRNTKATITADISQFINYAKWCRENGLPMLVEDSQRVDLLTDFEPGAARPTRYFVTIRDADYEIMRLRAPMMELGWGKRRDKWLFAPLDKKSAASDRELLAAARS